MHGGDGDSRPRAEPRGRVEPAGGSDNEPDQESQQQGLQVPADPRQRLRPLAKLQQLVLKREDSLQLGGALVQGVDHLWLRPKRWLNTGSQRGQPLAAESAEEGEGPREILHRALSHYGDGHPLPYLHQKAVDNRAAVYGVKLWLP